MKILWTRRAHSDSNRQVLLYLSQQTKTFDGIPFDDEISKS
jgi:hypothetical protein